ncbi:MAG: SprT family zinc-dependent metalloprotease [Alphaproteobacteria bacterium]|nr:SprT family zinc-dependent metalloprotease [Alphaproteobacteria bacterium]
MPRLLPPPCRAAILAPMLLIRSPKRRRTVALEVQSDGTLKVTAPMRTSLAWINAFITEKAGWIARRQKAVRERTTRKPAPLAEGSLVPFMGHDLTLHLASTDQNEPPSCWHDKEKNELHLKLHPALPPQALQAEIRTELALWAKKQARAHLQERLAFWAERMELAPTRLILTDPRKRWGSCNAKNEIRINWRVIMAAPEVIDYLLVHELAHIPHKNHGRAFWALVRQYIPDLAARRSTLHRFEKSAFFDREG